VPWAMSAFVVGAAVWCRTGALRGTAVAVVVSGLVWPAAFAVTWLARWVVAGAFLGVPETLEVVRRNVGIRTGGDHAGVSEAFGAGVRRNVTYWWEVVPTSGLVLSGCLLAAGVGLVLALRRGGPARWGAAAVLALPALAVPFWYTVLSNHSQIHAFFVNRGVAAALAVLTAACLAAAVRPHAGTGAPRTGSPHRPEEGAEPGKTSTRHDPVSDLAGAAREP
jgi:hypothetical protein